MGNRVALKSTVRPIASATTNPLSVPSGVSPIQRGLAILRRYGSNAHAYIPGIGSINGLQAGNYTLADGSTGVAAVDGLDGLMLDAAGSVGAELAGAIVVGSPSNVGAFTAVASGTSPSTLVTNNTYQISVTVSAFTSGGLVLLVGGTQATFFPASLGTFSGFVVSTAANQILQINSGAVGFVGTVSAFSVKQVTGIHATASGAARPILRLTSGKYSAEYNGAQALTLGSVPFTLADDFCIVGAYRSDSNAVNARVFSIYGAGSAVIRILHATDGSISASLIDDAATTQTLPIAGNNLGLPVIFALQRVSGVTSLYKNSGSAGASGSQAFGAATFTASQLGAQASANYLTGASGWCLPIKGATTPSDVLTLMRMVASAFPNAPSF